MAEMKMPMPIQRNARVAATDGELGRVQHVVVEPQTRAVTDLVVEQDGRHWLIPASAVAEATGKRVRLTGPRAAFTAGRPFDPAAFAPLGEDAAAAETALANGRRRPYQLQHTPQRLQLKEERLRVDTATEQAGVVRLSKRITERLETVTVPLREERLVIEVMPGGGTVRIGDRELGEGETMEVVLTQERATLAKETVIHEEVVVRKAVVEREQRFEETVRREELVVEQDGDLAVEAGAGEAVAPSPEDESTAREVARHAPADEPLR